MGKKKKDNAANFILHGSILAIAGILVRLIGIAYRIPLTRIIGDEGNGYYSGAFEIYNLLLILSSYTLPVAVSRLVSMRMALGEYKNAQRIFRCALLIACAVGGCAALFTFFGADFLAGTILSRPLSAIALRVLAPAVFFVAVMGVMRGYFQGMGAMLPTAVSQIVEGIINAVVSVAAAYVLFAYGAKLDAAGGTKSMAPAYGAAGSTLGTAVSGLFGLLFLIMVVIAYRKVMRRQLRKDHGQRIESYKQAYRVLFLTFIPIILSAVIYNISSVLDQGIFGQVLNMQGYQTQEVTNMWGIYSGKYKLLVNVPIAIASALTASIIPSLTGAIEERKYDLARYKVNIGIRFMMIVSIPCAVGLAVLASPILTLLFHDVRALPANLLYVGSSAVVFFALSTLSNGILQSMDKMKLPVIHAAIALTLHLILFVVMLVVWKMGVYAVVYSNLFFSLLMCILNGISIAKHLRYKQEVKKTFLIPLLASLLMGLTVFGANLFMQKIAGLGNTISTILALGIGAVSYGVLLILLKGITESELKGFPKGHLFIKIFKKLHLM